MERTEFTHQSQNKSYESSVSVNTIKVIWGKLYTVAKKSGD